MVNLISIDGQHQGVFGFPSCPPDSFEFCEVLRDLLEIAYQPEVQESLVQAQYWHDTTQKDLHRRMSQVISDFIPRKFKKSEFRKTLSASFLSSK